MKMNRKTIAIIAVIALTLVLIIGYKIYVNDFCIKSADRNQMNAVSGVSYSMVKDSEGEPLMRLTRSNYIELCKQDKYRLPF